MKPSFWKALEALGAAGSALHNWRHHLGADWETCRFLLTPTGRPARHVIDPAHPQRKLELMIDGEEDFVAVDDDPSIPPIPFMAADVEEMQPLWESVAPSLASAIGFDSGVWESQGNLRRVGSSQDAFGRVSAVLLFMPSGAVILIGLPPHRDLASDYHHFSWFMALSRTRQLLAVIEVNPGSLDDFSCERSQS